MTAKEQVIELLAHADIQINGSRPWDIQVKDDRFYDRVLADANLGAGEAYMDGWWECQALDQLFERALQIDLQEKIQPVKFVSHVVKSKVLNLQTKRLSKTVAEQHYDVGNDLYRAMLGKYMQYTCAYWPGAKNLDDAQRAKLDLICKKLGLKPGMHILELGSGFGGFAQYAASKYKCSVTAYNISKEQIAYASDWCRGLPVTFVEADYREAQHVPAHSFDRVVSIGLMEHVGHKNYEQFFSIIARALKPEGLALVHTIGANKTVWYTDPWIDKYIFPHGHLPSIEQIGESSQGALIIEDWHNFGADYDKTLMEWYKNCERSWNKLPAYTERFRRMWRYYLLSCAGGFRARKMQLWQLVLSPRGIHGGYRRVS
jgi:cyclopropane-fatty-acyl-phospholipid synthase